MNYAILLALLAGGYYFVKKQEPINYSKSGTCKPTHISKCDDKVDLSTFLD